MNPVYVSAINRKNCERVLNLIQLGKEIQNKNFLKRIGFSNTNIKFDPNKLFIGGKGHGGWNSIKVC